MYHLEKIVQMNEEASIQYELQKIFETSGRHLLTQKIVSKDDISCRYRLELTDGVILKCALGCLIKDEYYMPEIENKTVYNYTVVDTLNKSGIRIDNIEIEGLIRHLQWIHDGRQPDEWKQLLLQTGADLGLNSDFVEEF